MILNLHVWNFRKFVFSTVRTCSQQRGCVAGVISCAQPCNHASVARASAKHLPYPLPPRCSIHIQHDASGQISPAHNKKKLGTLLTTRPVFDAVWEDLANLNFDCPSRVQWSIHQRNWWIRGQKDAIKFARWKRPISSDDINKRCYYSRQ